MSEVLLVAASTAFDDYRLYSAYFCRPNKTFRPVSHVAFYSGEVEPLIPKILDIIDELELSEEAIERCTLQTSLHRRVLLAIVEGMRAHSSSWRGRRVKAILLSSHSAQDTVKLPWPIRNDLHTESGGTKPLVQGFRYIPLEAFIEHPRTTTELLSIAAAKRK